MDKTLLKEFQSWFAKYRREKKDIWCSKNDVVFYTACKNFDRLLNKTERIIDEKIDKEIRTKKQDRATLMKAKRLSKGKNVEAKYIDIRFQNDWDKIAETTLEPFIASTIEIMISAQENFENKIRENDPSRQTFEDFDPKKDPRFNK